MMAFGGLMGRCGTILTMGSGTLYTLLACLCWGLIFVVPIYMEGFLSVEVVIARYLLFGLFSAAFLVAQLPKNGWPKMHYWVRAAFVALMVNQLYYMALVMAIRYAGPAVTAIIASGLCPAIVAIIGNRGAKECNPKLLIWPSVLILGGVVLVNYTALCEHCVTAQVGEYLFGLVCAIFALAAWVWYLISNVKFLKSDPISPALWSTLIGTTTLFWTLLLAAGHYYFEVNPPFWQMLQNMDEGHEVFWVGGILLGVISGWLGALFWNMASRKVLISLGGQLLILETLFGVIMVYLYKGEIPPVVELIGVLILIVSVLWTTRTIRKLAV